jgi:hypothetical protein
LNFRNNTKVKKREKEKRVSLLKLRNHLPHQIQKRDTKSENARATKKANQKRKGRAVMRIIAQQKKRKQQQKRERKKPRKKEEKNQ